MKESPLGREAAGLDACVHCGFCLTACPTYLALEDENDSPRGRLVLMRSLLDEAVPLTDATTREHLDRCLGCRACETACPSGVPYGHLLEATRETLVAARPLPWTARAILWVFARRWALAVATAGARVVRAAGLARLCAGLPARVGFPMAMLASTSRSPRRRAGPREHATPTRESVALLSGCVMEGLFAPVNRATEDVLAAQGYRTVASPGQRCCGALHAHAGDAETARDLARVNIAAFEASDAAYIAVNSAGCGALLKEYGHLLRHDPAWHDRATAFAARVRDVSELLAAAGPREAAGKPLRAAYDEACHLHHAQRVGGAPIAVLRARRRLDLVPLVGSDQCCGSAGIYNLVEPDVASKVLEPKLAAIAEANVPVIATGNPGCLMQIGAGLIRNGSNAVTRHPVELLAEAYAEATLGE